MKNTNANVNSNANASASANVNSGTHGSEASKEKEQRVPSADEFPVLKANGSGGSGGVRGTSPNPSVGEGHGKVKAGAGGGTGGAVSGTTTPLTAGPGPGLGPGTTSSSASGASTPTQAATLTPGKGVTPSHTPVPVSVALPVHGLMMAPTSGSGSVTTAVSAITANGHAHGLTNGWANAMNGTGPTAAQLLREKEREKEREREREKGGGAASASGGSSPRVGKVCSLFASWLCRSGNDSELCLLFSGREATDWCWWRFPRRDHQHPCATERQRILRSRRHRVVHCPGKSRFKRQAHDGGTGLGIDPLLSPHIYRIHSRPLPSPVTP